MGADEAYLVVDPMLAGAGCAYSAHVLGEAIRKIGEVDLVLMGEGSDDDYTSQIPPRVAHSLGWPQITTVRKLQILDGLRMRATRDLEDELEVLECDLPAVVSVTSELNVPRLPPLTAILRAGRKPMHEWSLSDVLSEEFSGEGQIEVLSNLAPAQDRKNEIVEGDLDAQVTALVRALEQEGLI
jgi:electron transfer flavoprotein beta subunit